MRLPVAATLLSRVVHVTGPGSLARALEEGRLKLVSRGGDDELVLGPLRLLARDEKVIGEEARALATARSWPTNLAGTSYGWARLNGEYAREALPRIIRIIEREVFELESFARDPECDEEVRSLLIGTADLKRSVKQALSAIAPRATVPGAK